MRPSRLLCALAILSAAGVVRAEDAPAPKWFDEISWNAFVSTSYSFNTNHPDSGTNGYRVFDFDDRTWKLDVAELVVQKAASNPGDAGFRIDLEAGSSIPKIEASAGLFRDDDGKAEDFDLQQAYVSWIAPVGRGIRFDLGKWVTPAGAEVIEGYDGWNNNFSRGLLFGYAIPFTHTGLKMSVPLSDSVSMWAMATNGWDVAKDNNDDQTFGLGTSLAAGPVSFYALWMGGPERADSNDRRDLIDVVATVKMGDAVTFTVNGDWAREENGAGDDEDAEWRGIAAYLRCQMGSSFAMNFRAEHFDDRDGVRTGTVQKIWEVTLTPELALTDRMLLRFDLRYDRSNENVFDDDGDASRKQMTIALNALYHF